MGLCLCSQAAPTRGAQGQGLCLMHVATSIVGGTLFLQEQGKAGAQDTCSESTRILCFSRQEGPAWPLHLHTCRDSCLCPCHGPWGTFAWALGASRGFWEIFLQCCAPRW